MNYSNKSMTAPQPPSDGREVYRGYHAARVDDAPDFENDSRYKAMLAQRLAGMDARAVDGDGLTADERADVEERLLEIELSLLESELDLIED